MADPNRISAVAMRLMEAYDKPSAPLHAVIASMRVIVVAEPDASAGVVRVMLDRVRPDQPALWDMMTIIGAIYAGECGDDSLVLLVQAAAAAQGVALQHFDVAPPAAGTA